jgi:glutamate mutase epsilon subunit
MYQTIQHHIPVIDEFIKNEDGVDSIYYLYLQVLVLSQDCNQVLAVVELVFVT